MSIIIRPATLADEKAIAALIAESSMALLLPLYSQAQIEAAMATLGGLEFYRGAGYTDGDPVRYDMGGGALIDFVRMGKTLG